MVGYLASGGWVQDPESLAWIPLDAQATLRMAQALETLVRAVPGVLAVPARVEAAARAPIPSQSGGCTVERLEATYAEAMAAGSYGPAATLLRHIAELRDESGDTGGVEVRVVEMDDP